MAFSGAASLWPVECLSACTNRPPKYNGGRGRGANSRLKGLSCNALECSVNTHADEDDDDDDVRGRSGPRDIFLPAAGV